MALAAALLLGWPQGPQQQPPGTTQSVCASIRHRNSRRITTGLYRVVRALIHLVEAIEHDIRLERSTSAGPCDSVGELQEPWNRDALWRARHIHVIKTSTLDKACHGDSRTGPPRHESSWCTRAIVWSALQSYLKGCQPRKGCRDPNHQLERRIVSDAHIACALARSQNGDACHMQVDLIGAHPRSGRRVAISSSELEEAVEDHG